jgi:cobaltochelatase CobN
MLDAVRLNYWKPDAATRRELAKAYAQAAGATGLRERNAGVERFVRAELAPAAPASRARPAVVPVVVAASAPAPAAEAAPAAEPSPDGLQPVTGLKLEPTPAEAQPETRSVVLRLWVAFGAALLVAFGALVQWRRGRVAA